MSTVLPDAPPTEWTLADVQARLAGFPPNRIRSIRSPGMATEQDVLEAEARSNRICELIDGTLVEKTMASLESMLAAELIYFIRCYLDSRNLGDGAGRGRVAEDSARTNSRPMFLSSAGSVLPGVNSPKPPSIPSPPTWPSRSFPRATRRKKWIASCASTFRPACGWCGTSSPRPALHGPTPPRRVDGDRP